MCGAEQKSCPDYVEKFFQIQEMRVVFNIMKKAVECITIDVISGFKFWNGKYTFEDMIFINSFKNFDL